MSSSNSPINPTTPESAPWPDAMRAMEIPESAPLEKNLEQGITPAPETHEQLIEKKDEAKSDGVLDSAIETIRNTFKLTKKPTPQQPKTIRDELVLQVEKIMEDGIQDAYKELTPVQQQEFKIEGEKTAMQIRDLLRSAHVKIKKIFRLLLKWLRMLPGINVFFLEQEAKIKADKIIALNNWTKNNKL